MSEAPTTIYVQWSDDGQHIRKWSHEPFDGGTAFVPADTNTDLRAEVEALKDPNVVHVNMLRGGIAQPSIAQIIHIYGEDAILAALTQTKDTTDTPLSSITGDE